MCEGILLKVHQNSCITMKGNVSHMHRRNIRIWEIKMGIHWWSSKEKFLLTLLYIIDFIIGPFLPALCVFRVFRVFPDNKNPSRTFSTWSNVWSHAICGETWLAVAMLTGEMYAPVCVWGVNAAIKKLPSFSHEGVLWKGMGLMWKEVYLLVLLYLSGRAEQSLKKYKAKPMKDYSVVEVAQGRSLLFSEAYMNIHESFLILRQAISPPRSVLSIQSGSSSPGSQVEVFHIAGSFNWQC